VARLQGRIRHGMCLAIELRTLAGAHPAMLTSRVFDPLFEHPLRVSSPSSLLTSPVRLAWATVPVRRDHKLRGVPQLPRVVRHGTMQRAARIRWECIPDRRSAQRAALKCPR
jgi:hypothetical protein